MANAPMPQGQAPEPDEGSPQEESKDQGEGGGSVSDLIIGVDKSLAKILGLMDQAKEVDPKAKEAVQQAAESFRQGVQLLIGNGGGGPQPAGGQSPMEAGGSADAKPAY